MQVRSKGQVRAFFRLMRIKHDRIEELKGELDALRECKRLAPKAEQGCVFLLAPSQSGKTTAIKYYIEKYLADELIANGLLDPEVDRQEFAENQKKIIHVELSSQSGVKSFASDMLLSLGCLRYSHGTSNTMMQRAYDYFEKHGTELLIIDEAQHVRGILRDEENKSNAARELTASNHTTNSMKLLMIRGVVPILFSGLPEVRDMLMADGQIASRQQGELDFEPLVYTINEHRKMFEEFVKALGRELEAAGLVESASDMFTDQVIECIYEVACGRIGWAARLIERGCEVAIGYKTKLQVPHLEIATDEFAIRNGLVDQNPFCKLLRSVRAPKGRGR